MSNGGWLQSAGLTNTDSEDYGTLAMGTERSKPEVAFCTSKKCCRVEKSRKEVFVKKAGEVQVVIEWEKKKEVRKDVTRMASECPDCREFLMWKKEK